MKNDYQTKHNVLEISVKRQVPTPAPQPPVGTQPSLPTDPTIGPDERPALSLDDFSDFLFFDLKIKPEDCLSLAHSVSHFDSKEVCFKPGVDISDYCVSEHLFKGYCISTRIQSSRTVRVTFRDVPHYIYNEELFNIVNCYGKAVDLMVHFGPPGSDKARGLINMNTRSILMQLDAAKPSLPSYFWLEGPLPGDLMTRISASFPGQEQWCYHCLQPASSCEADARGKACKQLARVSGRNLRGRREDYMRDRRVKDKYMSMKDRYYLETYPGLPGAGAGRPAATADEAMVDETKDRMIEERDRRIEELQALRNEEMQRRKDEGVMVETAAAHETEVSLTREREALKAELEQRVEEARNREREVENVLEQQRQLAGQEGARMQQLLDEANARAEEEQRTQAELRAQLEETKRDLESRNRSRTREDEILTYEKEQVELLQLELSQTQAELARAQEGVTLGLTRPEKRQGSPESLCPDTLKRQHGNSSLRESIFSASSSTAAPLLVSSLDGLEVGEGGLRRISPGHSFVSELEMVLEGDGDEVLEGDGDEDVEMEGGEGSPGLRPPAASQTPPLPTTPPGALEDGAAGPAPPGGGEGGPGLDGPGGPPASGMEASSIDKTASPDGSQMSPISFKSFERVESVSPSDL
jgi:hypothetical protein